MKRLLAMLLVFVMVAALFSGLSAFAAEEQKTIIVGDINPPCTFDATGRYMSHWEKLVFDCLVDHDLEGNPIPAIATDWEYEDDLTLVMHLRDDVFCTNGEQITASDCLWSLKFWASETSQASNFTAFDLENSIADDENNTLTIKFSEPYGPSVVVLGNFWMWDEEWATNATPDEWWDSPNGSGPYTVVESIDSDHITFQLKDEYWGEMPEVESITYRYYSEPATMFIDMENGDIDIAVNVQASDAERVLANPDDYEGMGYEVRPLVDNMDLFLCDYVEYFEDENVRHAIFLALNGDDVGLGMLGPLYEHAISPMPQGITYCVDCNVPEQNVEEAQRLMAESAYPDGFELRFVVTTGQDLAATVIQDQLAQIGITVNVETYDPGTAVPMMQAGEVDLSMRVGMGGASFRDPMLGIGDVYARGSTMRATMQDDDEFNEHWQAATFSVDPEVRKENYEWMQHWLVDNYRVYPLAERCCFIVWNTETVESCPAVIASYISAKTINLA